MRLSAIATAVFAASTIAGCAGGSSSSAADRTASAASAEPSGVQAPQNAPVYPNAAERAGGAAGKSAGKTFVTKDSFARVYAWYRNALPPGAEQAHAMTPPQSALFVTGDPGDQQSVTIAAAGGKTTIVIANAKL